MKNVVLGSSLFQDLFDCRRDLDQVFGRVSSGGPFDEAPLSEITYGSFEGLFSLPEGVDPDKRKMVCGRGVLELAAPAAAAGLPSGIPANTAPMSRRIAA